MSIPRWCVRCQPMCWRRSSPASRSAASVKPRTSPARCCSSSPTRPASSPARPYRSMAASTCIEGGASGRSTMRVSRRGLLALAIPLMAARLSEAAQTEFENLDYQEGRLHWSRGSAAAAVGRAGVKADKREGDGATPAGTYPLVSVLYRKDRVTPPTSRLPVRPLAPNDGWVDEPTDSRYNRLVELPYPASAEEMWREDHLYDVLVVIGYNVEPVIPGAGS